MKPKVTFLTRHYPPNRNINGESVCDMVKYLQEEYQIESNVICIDRKSDGGSTSRDPFGNVIRINPIYQGKNGIGRFFGFLYDGYSLVRKSLKFKNSLIICTTSPPLLPFWASVIFNRNIKWGLWTLDLFPEGFHASNKISDKNIFYKWVLKKTYELNPSFLITLGKRQATHLQKKYKELIPHLTLPCGVFFFQDKSNEPPDWWRSDKLYFGYCGNLNDAHNPELIKGVVDAIDPEKHQIILALYGNRAAEMKAYAKGKPGVILVDSVPRKQLHYIDIHLVTLRKKWVHIAVPSKAVSAIFLGSVILFCGDNDSDNWQMFKSAGWFIEENDSIKSNVAQLIPKLTRELVNEKKLNTAAIIKSLQNDVLNSYKEVAKMALE